MRRKTSLRRRAVLFALGALAVGAPCCGQGGLGGSSHEVADLRIIAVSADQPYTQPGDTVTFRMTYADALGGEDGKPRPVQVMWLGGCTNPLGGDYLACLPQIAGVLQAVKPGMGNPSGLIGLQMSGPENSGVPNSLSFDMKVPEDVMKGGQPAANGTIYGTAYLFVLACAGSIRPAAEPQKGDFPIECVDDSGSLLGADSFIVGYTQVYAFGDGRTNENPPAQGISLDGTPMEDAEEAAPVVSRCPGAESKEPAGCGPPAKAAEECKTYEIEASVDDVAELDPEAMEPGGPAVREAVWIDYYADGGKLTGSKQLVTETSGKYHPKHAAKWAPPPEPGLYSLWAVVHDSRGGMSVARRFVKVE